MGILAQDLSGGSQGRIVFHGPWGPRGTLPPTSLLEGEGRGLNHVCYPHGWVDWSSQKPDGTQREFSSIMAATVCC